MRRAVACGLALTLALLPSGRGSFHTGGPESYFPLWEEPPACREGAVCGPRWWIDYYYQGAWHTVYREGIFDTSFAERLVTRGRCAGLSNACFLMPSVVLETAGRYQLCQGVFT